MAESFGVEIACSEKHRIRSRTKRRSRPPAAGGNLQWEMLAEQCVRLTVGRPEDFPRENPTLPS
ncbi:transcriptional antiterminator [Anopheles sinensis]|uniref:Transcriptional antiterminator n=1 Tax=Anopheles sinensis TaxID=74873 RepID=A0A084VTN6_ANOSI|nr:transcriptional antiterminator [Anopheles sinensis]